MKQKTSVQSLVLGATILIGLMLFSLGVRAHPYASGVTNDNGTIRFVMNEGGASVNVKFEDDSILPMGVLPKGATNFSLGSHTSYQIICNKVGNGTPFLISSDTFSNSIWANPRGITVNQNPKSHLFGRIYAGSGSTGGFGYGNPGFKPQGLYAFNADQSEISGWTQGTGTNAAGAAAFPVANEGPWRMRVAPDDTVLVTDWSIAGAAIYQFQPDLTSSNLVLGGIGRTAGLALQTHGDGIGTPLMLGSLAEGNLVLWIADERLPVPGSSTVGPNTVPGDYNCVYRFDIGSGPLPWNNPPNYAYTVGLSGIQGLRPEIEIGKDGKIIAAFGRANLSNPNIQVLDPTGSTLLYTSGYVPPFNGTVPADAWNGINGSGAQVGSYGGVRVSPDGRYLVSFDLNSGLTLASLTNGVPDNSSIFRIPNTPYTANSRGLDWDAALNLYTVSSGQLLMRIYSLGLTSTCITSNDWTGTNGSFQIILPDTEASIAATQPLASQNYVNNSPPGTPIPGVFTISLNKSTLTEPVTVSFTRAGTAALGTNYQFNLGTDANGVIIYSNAVTFPAGTWPHGGNWRTELFVTPTATPVSTNTLTAIVTLAGGSNYLAGAPSTATVAIQNTGPQLLLLTAAPSGTTMYRGITNDYARFIITRLGDTNGPGNSQFSVTPLSYTVTNVSYFGTAVYPTDYKARAQRLDPAGNGVLVPPVDGPSAIVINPGDQTVYCAVGTPVRHTDLSATPTNLTIIVNLTNAVTGITNKSQEGYEYTVGTATTTLTLIDNAVGPEVVLWSNPLNSAADSVNWTLTFASSSFAPGSLPLVVPNYPNVNPDPGQYDFDVTFGHDPAADGVAPSAVMAANGWSKVLRMTANKAIFAHAGVNVFPQGQFFQGNYALRFNMYLSLYQFARNNPNIGAAGREFAMFGVNQRGVTNCIWRPDVTLNLANVMGPTNSSGQWFTVDAGNGSTTPADFEVYLPPPLPNNANPGTLGPKVSSTSAGQNGVFKSPIVQMMNAVTPTVTVPGGGTPAGVWSDVSVEVRNETNITLLINRSQILSTFLTNGSFATSYTNGNIMLGYLDPNASISDSTAFAYFSNVRVVEVSPYINVRPLTYPALSGGALVAQFSSLTFTSSATYATAPITNVWYRGTGLYLSANRGVPTFALQTNTANATSMTDTYTHTFNSIIDGTNYMCVFSDPAGAVTSAVVGVTVVLGPTNRNLGAGSLGQLQVRANGPVTPTAYQWYYNNVSNLATAAKLANGTHYAGVTSTNLFLTNVVVSDAGYYWCAVTNTAVGFVIPEAAVVTVTIPPGGAVVSPASQTNLWGSNTTFTVSVGTGDPPFTYRWKSNGVNLVNSTHYAGVTTDSLTISNVTTADNASYTVGVTNSAGGVLSSAGLLTVIIPPPAIDAYLTFASGNLTLNFSSTNPYDTASAFTLQSAGVVTGPYTNNLDGSVSGTAPNFQIVLPVGDYKTNSAMFFRVKHVD